jgi:nucleotide-binding universal stress UspA family protein
MASRIVVGTDGSSGAQHALDEAIRLARALGAEVHVVSAYQPLRQSRVSGGTNTAGSDYGVMEDSQVDSILDQAAAHVRRQELSVVCHPVRKDAADGLLDVAEEVGAEVIVVGSKGMHGAQRLKLGNVPNQVSHKARCNVLIVNTDGR